jgi:hypothetical protein
MKKFISGFIVAALLFTFLPIKAAVEQFICTKADYKVAINGKDYSHPDLPILNYKGNTYAPLRSMLQAAGMDVTWNAATKKAEVSTKESEGSKVPETAEKIKQTPDGITDIDTWEGKQYIGFIYIRNKIRENGYDFAQNLETKQWQITKGDEIILDDIPTSIVYGAHEVEVNYYINTILPLIK